MIEAFCAWLEATSLSLAIQGAGWIIPACQTLHILALAVLLSSTVLLDVKVLGLGLPRVTLPETADRFLPAIWPAVMVMFLSGVVLIIGEPKRDLLNPVFQTKMALLLCALAVTLAIRRSLRDTSTPALRIAAAASLMLWIGIAICGRLIAYSQAG